MKIINKKGMESKPLGLLLALAVLGALLIIMLIVVPGKANKGLAATDVYLSTSDYDQDGRMDSIDDCPCGVSNKMEVVRDKAWCRSSLSQDECKCMDAFANSALETVVGAKKYKQDNMFWWDPDYGCMYSKDAGCKYVIYADKNDVLNTKSKISECAKLV